MGIARARQQNLAGWVLRNRAGTAADIAARAAGADTAATAAHAETAADAERGES
jgi:bifunctional UDP-N-acetylglucosamine pyrophosphorylase/glucosamine-1-phosphate N-acetyltransferase